MGTRLFRVLLLICTVPAAAAAQSVPHLPASYAAPNADRVFVGVNEAHEAGAYLARARGPAAAWYNVAGLANDETSAISGNARGFELNLLSGNAPGQQDSQASGLGMLPQYLGIELGPDALPWESIRGGIAFLQKNSWASRVWWFQSDDTRHWSYVSESAFNAWELSASAAWAVSPELRLGVSLGLDVTHLFINDRFTGLLLTPGDAPATARSRLAMGLDVHLAPTLAAQWAPLPWLALGAVLRMPGVRLGGMSDIQFEELNGGAAGIENASLMDDGARFEFRSPLELDVAVALLLREWELEVDVRYHAATGTYTMFASNQPIRTVSAPPGGPAVETPFGGLQYQGRAVFNVAVGGSRALSEKLRFHAGIYNSASPVSGEQALLRQIAVWGVRGGISFHAERLALSAGVGVERARSSATSGLTAPASGPIDDAVQMLMLQALLGLEYRF